MTRAQTAGNSNHKPNIGHQRQNKAHLTTAAVTMDSLAAREWDRSKDRRNEQSLVLKIQNLFPSSGLLDHISPVCKHMDWRLLCIPVNCCGAVATKCLLFALESKMFYFRYICVWSKSSLPSCSGKGHTVIKQITRAAWRKAASNCICWTQSQHHTADDPHLPYPGDESPLNLCFIILTQERKEALPWTLHERPPTLTKAQIPKGLLFY